MVTTIQLYNIINECNYLIVVIRKWSCICYRAGVSLEVLNMLLPARIETEPDPSKWIKNLEVIMSLLALACLKKPSFLFCSWTVLQPGAKSFRWH